MFDFLKTLFNPPPPSSTTAKERLRLVLLSDHLSLSPETLAALKADLLAVISRYVEIDSSHADVTFEHRENDVAVLASIPITGVRERTRPPVPSLTTAVTVAQPPPPVEAAASIDMPPETYATVASKPSENGAPTIQADAPVSAAARRRRRKKAQNAANRPNANGQHVGKPAQA